MSGAMKGAVATFVALFLLPVLLIVFFFVRPDDRPSSQFAQGQLATGVVPPEYEAWVIQAGSLCPEVSPPLIAAQIEQESAWNPNAVSPAGAEGLSQFMPYTWPSYGTDANGNGVISAFDPPDAIMAQGHFDCEIAEQAKRDIASGRISGDLTDIILSAYNCGYGCVLAAGGPNINNGETEGYAPGVKAKLAKYQRVGTAPGGPDFRPGGPFGNNVVAAAMQWIGTTYAWGGGNKDGPTKGIRDGGVADSFGDYDKVGFDCSGLVIYAIAQASGMQLILPHYTGYQLNHEAGQPVPADQLAPGDIVFPAGGSPQHVAIYKGNGEIVEAPQSGGVVQVSPLSSLGPNPQGRRFG